MFLVPATLAIEHTAEFDRYIYIFLKYVSALVVWILLANISMAAPDQDDPAGALAVRPETENQQIQGAALKQYQDAAATVQKCQEALDQGHLERIKPTRVTAAYEAALRLEELALQLSDVGETAGVDFGLRAKELNVKLDQFISEYRKLPKMAAKIDSSYGNIARETQQRKPAIAKAEKLTAAGKHIEAAEVLLEATYRIRSMAAWFTGKKRQFALGSFAIPLQTALPSARKQRNELAREALLALSNSQTLDFTALMNDIQSASDALRATGKVQRQGNLRTGPQLIREFSQRYQQMHHAAVQYRALNWARGSVSDESESLNQMLVQQKECAEHFIPALAQLITADSVHTSAAEVEPRYAAYLQALAPLVSLSAGRAVPDDLSEALETLASKSAPFAQGARNYRLAMSELLRWRSRQAAAMARSRTGKKPALHEALLEAVRVDGDNPGLVRANAEDTSQLAIGKSVPDAMKVAVKKLLDQEITVDSLVGFPDRGNLVVSRFHARNYAWFRRVEGWDDALAALREDLMVHPAAPPLSLEAAVALSSAERGDVATVGGTIIGLALEPLVTRMATLSEQDGLLVPMGPLPPEPVGTTPLSQLLMRFKLTPSWVRHEYFFVLVE